MFRILLFLVGFPFTLIFQIYCHDFGSCVNSDLFQKTCVEFGVITKKIPCESHNSLGPGERYHAPLKTAYKKLEEENPEMANELRLSIGVHELNNTANPEGLVPTLLVLVQF